MRSEAKNGHRFCVNGAANGPREPVAGPSGNVRFPLGKGITLHVVKKSKGKQTHSQAGCACCSVTGGF